MNKTFTAEVEVSLNEFDVDDLIDDLIKRYLTEYDIDRLIKFIKTKRNIHEETSCNALVAQTLEEVMKLELFKEALNRFTISELEKRLSDVTPAERYHH